MILKSGVQKEQLKNNATIKRLDLNEYLLSFLAMTLVNNLALSKNLYISCKYLDICHLQKFHRLSMGSNWLVEHPCGYPGLDSSVALGFLLFCSDLCTLCQNLFKVIVYTPSQ